MTETVTFLELYRHFIRPRLEAVDLFLRTEEEPYAPGDVAELLGTPAPAEHIGREEFLHILFNGESALCCLVRREAERGAPVLYTSTDIAYIYGLAPDAVQRACAELHMTAATALMLPEVFARIPIQAASAYSITQMEGFINPD